MLFQPPARIESKVFARLPDHLRVKGRRSGWSFGKGRDDLHSFLEGPSFDRAGNLYLVDIPYGRILRISPQAEWTVVCEYDGWPNGLKIHSDGRIFIADHRRGILQLDAGNGRITPVLEHVRREGFKGTNDLIFASNGDLYFTDQGQSGIVDPTGRVYRLKANGDLQRLAANVPSPNGITVSTTDKRVYVAVTRSQQIWRLPLMHDGQVSKTGVAVQLSGGVGPDGIEMDAENGLVVCHLNVGVWRFDAHMLPTHLVYTADRKKHDHMANIAFGGPDYKTLYITESLSGDVLMARMPVAGKKLFGLQ